MPCSSSSSNVFKTLAVVILSFLVLAVSNVSAECTCDPPEDGDHNKKEALKYKIVAFVSILAAGAVGVALPQLGKKIPALKPEKDIFFVIKAFAAGVILATGFIHILPDAFDDLTSPCLNENPWGNFPFTGFIAMMSAILTLMVDTLATGYYRRSNLKNSQGAVMDHNQDQEHVYNYATHAHPHGSANAMESSEEDKSLPELMRHRIISQVLELGIVVHSVIIGIALGASEDPSSIKPLVGALTFHQFFEGVGLGGCITQAQFKSRAVVVMILFFSLTTPIGIGIGIAISSSYVENSPTALITGGVLNAAAAGILIYMSLVDLLAADFMNPRLQQNGKLQFSAYVSLLLGVTCMAIIAKWA
ncbi:hypothetical protein MKW98_013326 [Papaver atlanticum]|uniref:Uncharacterized protein n=1 Tax=Papaver atlanticum TaxID=357466 RepID=A0AAD4XK33_9MAGN|nr:hypothetical protein MKW98_013326 [Papaver atlanticum]